jgi:hypothetical protein
MPDLPPLPTLTDNQFAALVDVFRDMAPTLGVDDPAEAYVRWSLDNLVALVRQRAYSQMEQEVTTLRDTKRAQVDAMLADLIGSPPSPQTIPVVDGLPQLPRTP